MKANAHLRFLDGLRGLAAFYVMVFHARWLLWEGYLTGYVLHPDQYSFVAKIVAHVILLFSFGHQMVLLFFVLSGFVIHLRFALRLHEKPATSTFDWRAYFIRRAKRLYPPLIFTMILTFGLDQLGKALGFVIYFQPTVLNLDFKPIHDPITAVGNLLFVMAIYVSPWGMNGALWSLAYEWWFYMIYPLFWWLTKRSILVASMLVGTLYLLSFFPEIWPIKLFQVVFSLMICWWFGALLADCYAGRLRIKFWKIAPLSFLFIGLVPLTLLRPPQSTSGQVLNDTLWALAFTGLLAACVALKNCGRSLRLIEIFQPLGDISYTLYVTHFPILIFISGWLMSQSAVQSLPQDPIWVLFGISVCLGIAYIAHFLTERPFKPKRSLLPQGDIPIVTSVTTQ